MNENLPDPIIDRDAIIEKAARKLHRIDCNCPEPDAPDHSVDYRDLVEAVAADLADDLLAPFRALHVPDGEPSYPGHRPVCIGCTEECAYCEGNHYHDECPVIRLCDQIEGEVVR